MGAIDILPVDKTMECPSGISTLHNAIPCKNTQANLTGLRSVTAVLAQLSTWTNISWMAQGIRQFLWDPANEDRGGTFIHHHSRSFPGEGQLTGANVVLVCLLLP